MRGDQTKKIKAEWILTQCIYLPRCQRTIYPLVYLFTEIVSSWPSSDLFSE